MKLSAGVFICLCGILLWIGCKIPEAGDNTALAAARNAAYHRAGVQFTNAAFLKPSETWTDELGVKLAPLLFHEIGMTSGVPQFLRVRAHATTGATLESSTPTIYFRKEKLYVKGAERDRAVFLWFYQHNGKVIPQGVRITMDSDEHPALWEILHDTSGIYQVYASQSLEETARKEFGSPVEGRKSALEHPVAAAPHVVVSRVISDGPMAMGPAIYLDEQHRDVATLICRCMPPQASNVTSSAVYEVVQIEDSTEAQIKQVLRDSRIPSRHWLNEGAEEMDLRLRLPSRF